MRKGTLPKNYKKYTSMIKGKSKQKNLIQRCTQAYLCYNSFPIIIKNSNGFHRV